MAFNSLAQSFAKSYSAPRRIGGSPLSHQNQAKPAKSPFGQSVTVFKQTTYQAPERVESPAPEVIEVDEVIEASAEVSEAERKAAALKTWNKDSDLAKVQNAEYEARRLLGDVVTVWHIEYFPTAAMTPCWTAYATAYGLRFKVLLWMEDIEFISQALDLSICRAEFTPAKPLELVLRKIDRKRGLTGVSGVFVGGKCLFVGESLEDIS